MNIFMDSLRFNLGAGGVIQFSDALKIGFVEAGLDVDLSSDCFLCRNLDWIGRGFGRFSYETVCSCLMSRGNKFIFPNYYLPLGLGRRGCSKSVVVIHDFQYKYFPEFFSKKKIAWMNLVLNRVHNYAGAVVCISEATKCDYIKYLGPRGGLFVVNNPVDVNCVFDAEHQLEGRYVIANAHFYPHKNFSGVVSFYSGMVDAGYDGGLLITGGGKERVLEEIRRDFPRLHDRIIHLGFVDKERLVMLQKKADALISLSKFEGFNLPAAECSMLGTPLILSDIPVHKELFGHAFFVDVMKNDCFVDYASVFRFIDEKKESKWEKMMGCQPSSVAMQYFDIVEGLG